MIVLKILARLRPSIWKAMMLASAISAASRPYSIAVAPRWSARKLGLVMLVPAGVWRVGPGGGLKWLTGNRILAGAVNAVAGTVRGKFLLSYITK